MAGPARPERRRRPPGPSGAAQTPERDSARAYARVRQPLSVVGWSSWLAGRRCAPAAPDRLRRCRRRRDGVPLVGVLRVVGRALSSVPECYSMSAATRKSSARVQPNYEQLAPPPLITEGPAPPLPSAGGAHRPAGTRLIWGGGQAAATMASRPRMTCRPQTAGARTSCSQGKRGGNGVEGGSEENREPPGLRWA